VIKKIPQRFAAEFFVSRRRESLKNQSSSTAGFQREAATNAAESPFL